MKTRIILDHEFLIKEYPFVITMSDGDIVEFNDKEYTVASKCLCIDKDVIEIYVLSY